MFVCIVGKTLKIIHEKDWVKGGVNNERIINW